MKDRGLVTTRRAFLKTAAAVAAGPYILGPLPWAPATARRPASGSSWAASASATWAEATMGTFLGRNDVQYVAVC